MSATDPIKAGSGHPSENGTKARNGVVIAGGGLAAQRCAETLRARGYEASIRIICAEEEVPYDRPPLSKGILAGDLDAEQLHFREADWYVSNGVELILGARAAGLDPTTRTLKLEDGRSLTYDDLLIATGAAARSLPLLDGFSNAFPLRTLADARRLRSETRAGAQLVIVGAGFIGQEVASTARAQGAEVTIIEALDLPLRTVLGADVGRWLVDMHREEGVRVHLSTQIAAAHGNGRVEQLELAGGERIDCDVVVVARDRNRIAIQSDILGAASFDIHNILCLSGDHQSFGDCATGQNVHDIDSMQLIQTVRHMRDEGKFLGGDEIKRPPQMFVGAAANPFADPYEIRVPRLAKKVAAGAEFIQTQCIYNLDKFEDWMKKACDRGLPEKVAILAGLTPMKSVGMARYMKNRVPGMDVPDEIVKRLADTPKEKQAEEGINICVEAIERLKDVKGVAGFHIMAIEWEEKVPEIVERAGLFPRPSVN